MATTAPDLTNVDGYTVCVYPHPGMPPERTEFTDLPKAEKAFTDAKFAAILWATRPPAYGLGWIKLKEKATPPPAPPAAPKPAAPPAAAGKPAVPPNPPAPPPAG